MTSLPEPLEIKGSLWYTPRKVEYERNAYIYMTKEGLVEAVMQAAGLDTKAGAQRAVEAVFDTITQTLARGEDVTVTGFGTFRVTRRAAREGRNPKTGERIHIPAAVVPKFRAGKGLKDAVK